MMNVLSAAVVFFSSAALLPAQNGRFQELLERGKDEYRKSQSVPLSDDYLADSLTAHRHLANALDALAEAESIDPEHQEVHYFLAYTYDRHLFGLYRAADVMEPRDIEKTRIISGYLEKIIEISPRYDGEIIILGPYSKLSSTWGSLALSYALRGAGDSARWAFREGKRRGGFPLVALEYCRNILKSCGPDAILVTGGDDATFPMWYLQAVEGYRTDVSVVNLSLLNARWYSKWLKSTNMFGTRLREISISDRDIEHLFPERIDSAWSVAVPVPADVLRAFGITDPEAHGIAGGNTEFRAGGTDGILYVQDKVMLDIIKTTGWRRPIYFTGVMDDEFAAMGLDEHLVATGIAMRLHPVPLRDGSGQLDVPLSERLMLSDGAEGFSWDAWSDTAIFDNPDIAIPAGAYLRTGMMLADHYSRQSDGGDKVIRILTRMETLFPPDRLPDVYKTFCHPFAELYAAAGRPERAEIWRNRCEY